MRIASLSLVLTALLGAAPAHANESACPQIQALNAQQKAGEYCENFRPYASVSQVKSAEDSCRKFYSHVVTVVQHICAYVDDAKKFQSGEQALMSDLDKRRGQTASDVTAQVTDSRARALSRKWWLQYLKDEQNLDLLYRDYLEGKLKPLTQHGMELLQSEVMSCGSAGQPVSLNLLGLGGISTEEARKTYEKLRPELGKLSHDMMVNSNRLKNTAQRLSGIVDRAQSMTEAPEAPPASGAGDPEHEHEPGVAAKTGEGALLGAAQGQTERGAHQILKLHHGKLVANPVAGVVGGAFTLLDVGLRWIEHHKFDQTDGVFIGLRIAVTGLGAAGALPSGGAGVFVAAAIEAGLNWLEGLVRGAQTEAMNARLETYLPYAKKKITPQSTSQDLSRAWHNELYVRPSEIDLRGNFTTPNPRFPHETCP